MNSSRIKIVECPRDAMQGIPTFIPTEEKITYLNQLLKVGFHSLDFGSFVSPKAIPQMADTADVLAGLAWESSPTRLLAIVANLRGAEAAAAYKAIRYQGFPLSISETFQQRNTNKSIEQAFEEVARIQEMCKGAGQELVCYISMGFGNPYGDPYDEASLSGFVEKLARLDVRIISLSDTIGSADEMLIRRVFPHVQARFPELELGLHLHSRYADVYNKTKAAVEAGCRRIDGALKGFGGCPMAKDELLGNMATEEIVRCLKDADIKTGLNEDELAKSFGLMPEIML